MDDFNKATYPRSVSPEATDINFKGTNRIRLTYNKLNDKLTSQFITALCKEDEIHILYWN